MRFLLVAFAVVVAAGCEQFLDSNEPLVIKNGCRGSWLVVLDGEGRMLVNRLNEGSVATVEIEGYRGSTVRLFASGYEVGSNKDLGTAETSRTIPRRSSSLTGPSSQVDPWVVSWLYSSAPDGGCRR